MRVLFQRDIDMEINSPYKKATCYHILAVVVELMELDITTH